MEENTNSNNAKKEEMLEKVKKMQKKSQVNCGVRKAVALLAKITRYPLTSMITWDVIGY